MARYRTIDVRMWGDEKFCSLSRPQPNGQTLWTYLLTGECTGPLPGLFRAGEQGLSEQLGWSLKDFRKCWAEIADKGMAQADWQARVVWIPRRIYYSEPDNTNVVKSWRSAWDEIPDCDLKRDAWGVFDRYMGQRDQAATARAVENGKPQPKQSFREMFRKWCPDPSIDDPHKGRVNGYVNGSGNGIGNGSGDGSGNSPSIQEQEQEQEQDLLPPTPLRGADVRPPTRAERKAAEELRRRSFGRCPHEPRCETYEDCLVTLVLAARAQRAAARASPRDEALVGVAGGGTR